MSTLSISIWLAVALTAVFYCSVRGSPNIDPSVFQSYQDLKSNKHVRYYIYKLAGNNLVIDESGSRDKTFDDFKDRLMAAAKKKECRIAVYDFPVPAHGMIIDCLAYIFWCLDDASSRSHFLYASVNDIVARSFVGIKGRFNFNEANDWSYDSIIKDIAKRT